MQQRVIYHFGNDWDRDLDFAFGFAIERMGRGHCERIGRWKGGAVG